MKEHCDTTFPNTSNTMITNGLDNFWSLFRRALKGTYVSVEPFPPASPRGRTVLPRQQPILELAEGAGRDRAKHGPGNGLRRSLEKEILARVVHAIDDEITLNAIQPDIR